MLEITFDDLINAMGAGLMVMWFYVFNEIVIGQIRRKIGQIRTELQELKETITQLNSSIISINTRIGILEGSALAVSNRVKVLEQKMKNMRIVSTEDTPTDTPSDGSKPKPKEDDRQ